MIRCVCVDESMGMSFNRRRQSRDKKLTERLLSICAERKLYISDYSRPLFEGFAADIKRELARKGKITMDIPWFGKYTFTPADVDVLYKTITGEEVDRYDNN